MGDQVAVRVDDTTFYVEAESTEGVAPVALNEAFSFDNVRDTVASLAAELRGAWATARPDQATVEFGLNLTVKSGRLTALLVEGSGEASLKISMQWRRASEKVAPDGAVSG